MNRKTVSTVIIVAGLLVLTLSFWAYGPYTTIDPVFMPGTQVENAKYVIWQEGTSYYSKNGDTGAVDYSGTNASLIIQTTLNALESGIIHINKGTYNLSTPLNITDKTLILQGEGWGTYPYDTEGTCLYKQFNGDLITISYTDYKGPFVIRDMALVSDKDVYSGSGIVVTGAYSGDGWLLENLRVHDFDGACINVTDAGKHTLSKIYASLTNDFAIWYNGVGDWQWYDVEADWGAVVDKGGAYFFQSSGEIIGGHFEGYFGILSVSSTISITGSKFSSCSRSSIFLSNCRAVISGCRIANSNADNASDGYGILVYASSDVVISGNQIYDTRSPDPYMRYAILQSGAVEQTGHRYINNYFGDCYTHPVKLVWNDTLVKYNAGYITEKYGTSEGSNDDFIAFNVTFSESPQTVLITVQESDARYIAQVKTKNTTHFQLYLYDETAGALETTDKTISWFAEYQP